MFLISKSLREFVSDVSLSQAIEMMIQIEVKAAPFSDGQIWELLAACEGTYTVQDISETRSKLGVSDWLERIQLDRKDSDLSGQFDEGLVMEFQRIISTESKFAPFSDFQIVEMFLGRGEFHDALYDQGNDSFTCKSLREYLRIPDVAERSIHSILDRNLEWYCGCYFTGLGPVPNEVSSFPRSYRRVRVISTENENYTGFDE